MAFRNSVENSQTKNAGKNVEKKRKNLTRTHIFIDHLFCQSVLLTFSVTFSVIGSSWDYIALFYTKSNNSKSTLFSSTL